MILTALLLAAATPAATAPIVAANIREHDRILSSDAFAGRGPAEIGEEKTIAYIAEQFAKAGLQPAGDKGGWYQDVPLVRLARAPGATMALTLGGRAVPLTLGRDATLSLRNPGDTRVANAPLVFGGFGIVDSKLGWNAYEGVDMAGKVAVVLANDPDFEGGKDLGFEGRRLTYAGRIGAKFEAAARAGAIGVLVIHEDAAASYPFLQVSSSDPIPTLTFAPLAPSTLKLSGWLQGEAAARLLRHAGLDLASLKTRARNPAFRAFPLTGATFSAAGSLKATEVVSRNVVGKLPGASRPEEAILYGAHWDANGLNAPIAGDGIRNGAVDNGVGTSELLEVARAFGAGPRPQRTVIFTAWTAEEKGLLGAEYYAAHPLFPLARTAAMINLDPHVSLPAARNLELVGGGRVSLEADLKAVAASQGLTVIDEPSVEAGWYFRSDQFAFAKKGVPAITFRGGRDLVQGGTAKGNAIVSAYNQNRYHQPNDEFDPSWDFAGPAQEASVAYALGRRIADSSDWPSWNAGNEYDAVRAATEAERKR